MSEYKLVPVEPTTEMAYAGIEVHGLEDCADADVHAVWEAMLAAAPAVQGEPVGFVNPKLMRHLGVSHDGVVMGSKADSDRTMPLYAAPQPTGYNFADAMRLCSEGLNEWKAKAHNKRWWKRIDGTPIPNDLLCCIAEAFTADQPAQPAEQQPAPDVAGLVQQHHRDSAEIRRLCQDRDEQRDGRLAALERSAKAEADVAGLVEALEFIAKSVHPQGNGPGVVIRDVDGRDWRNWLETVEQFLAAHRKQETSHDNQ